MSSIRTSTRVKTETLSAFTHSATKYSRLKSQPNQPSLIGSSQMKIWTQGSVVLGNKVRRPAGMMALQQPHFIKVALSSQLKQSCSRIRSNKSRFNEEEPKERKYEILKQLSEGSTGRVFLGRTHLNQKVAIKQVIASRNKHNNELTLLKSINHPNLIQLKDHFFKAEGDRCLLHLVTDYYPYTLHQIIKQRCIDKQMLPRYLYQLLTGLEYLHRKGVMHRDLTPHNILVDNTTQRVVIADFGSAKYSKHNQQSISYVCARAYRAPELLFGSTRYGCEVDMWSFGCILLQIVNGSPVFKGKTSIEQTLEIMKRLGTPTYSQMTAMNAQFSFNQYQILPKIRSKPWKDILNLRDDALLDFIDKLMVYDPKKRLTPSNALQHPYLRQAIEDKNLQLQLKIQLEDISHDCNVSQTKSIDLSIESPESPTSPPSKNQKIELSTQSSAGYGFRSVRGASGILKRRLF